MRSTILLLTCLALSSAAPLARSEPLDPALFASGGSFPPGSVTIDTDALTVNGAPWPNAGVLALGAPQDVAVFTFDGDAVTSGSVTLNGSLPAVILFRGPAAISGFWTVNAGRRLDGPGRGGNPINGGGGGGGFGGAGGQGGTAGGGGVYGSLGSLLESGSGGGGVLGGPDPGEGAKLGGGAIEIGALGLLNLSGATIHANGQHGTQVFSKGSGGGSGGGIFLHAFDVALSGGTELRVDGGNGGNGNVASGFPGGGGGGGGRISILRNTSGAYTPGGALLSRAGGAAGATGQNTTGAGSAGTLSTSSSPSVGVPEPASLLLGLAALATLAGRRRAACTRRRTRRREPPIEIAPPSARPANATPLLCAQAACSRRA